MRLKDTPKRVLVDANFLIAWKSPDAPAEARERAEHFIDRLCATQSHLVIPAPAIAEYLVKAELSEVISMDTIRDESWVTVGSFDYEAAIEMHLIDRAALYLGRKKDGIEDPWQRIKLDRQIVAIARTHECDLIVTGDRGVMATAMRVGIPSCSIEDLDSAAIRWRPRVAEARLKWEVGGQRSRHDTSTVRASRQAQG
ncbi:MAG TPA: type II toxin-antitoxin system VapC family toxin [Luteibacter sp.]|jgi:predicted nucleic acid-binding protein|uniref:type II toxin-antitoxin system VapC family toxin n=1 Tax=Luteibacter sp. TaxID=1886636 RepID=UPI002F42024E